jgi:type VI secretion system protein ImpF
MARQNSGRLVRPSLLDRLIDEDPRAPEDPETTQAASIEAFMSGVGRDLELLLNTRRPPVAIPEGFDQLHRSVFAFGIPDTTGLGRDDHAARDRLLRWIEEAIATFEPRLRNVRVLLGGVLNDGTRRLRFVVSGQLQMDPQPQPVAFDATLNAGGTYEVETGTPARA